MDGDASFLLVYSPAIFACQFRSCSTSERGDKFVNKTAREERELLLCSLPFWEDRGPGNGVVIPQD